MINRLLLWIPYSYLIIFFGIPFLIVLAISFTQPTISVPPFSFDTSHVLKNYSDILKDPLYFKALMSSLKIAGIAATVCLIMGYSAAYAICRQKNPFWYLFGITLPFWTSFLVRVYAWISVLSTKGLINTALLNLGLISAPLMLLNNDYAVVFGIVYCYLPFAVLPLYASLSQLDRSVIEAAYDLGASTPTVMMKIIIPLTRNSILAAFTLVFIPAIGEFVIPELLGAPDTLMIGRLLWIEFFNHLNWPKACALTILLMGFFTGILMLQRQKSKMIK